MTPIYYIAVFFVFHCFFLSKCGKILFAAKHGGGFFGFLGFCRFKKNRAVGGGQIFPHKAEKGRKAASLLRVQPGFSPWGFADYGSPSRLCGGGFFRTGRKRAQSGKPFAAQPGFSPWGFAGYGSPSRFCGGRIFSHGAEKGRTAERRAGFGFIPKRIKRNSGNYSLASSGSKRLCRLRKSRQSGREKIAVSATCGAITV